MLERQRGGIFFCCMFIKKQCMNQHELFVLSSCMQALRLGSSRCPSATAVVILPVWTVCWPETLTVPGTSQPNGALDYPHQLTMEKGKALIHKYKKKIVYWLNHSFEYLKSTWLHMCINNIYWQLTSNLLHFSNLIQSLKDGDATRCPTIGF